LYSYISYIYIYVVSKSTQTDAEELAVFSNPKPKMVYENQGEVYKLVGETDRIHFYLCVRSDSTNCKAMAYFVKSKGQFITRIKHDHNEKA